MQSEANSSLAAELLDIQHTLGWMDLVIGSISDAVYVSDKKSRLVFANQYFADLLNVTRVFLFGRQVSEVFDVSPMDDNVDTAQVKATINDDNSERVGLYEWHDVAGGQRVFRITSRNLSTTGQTVYLARDVTKEYELSRMKTSFIDLASHQLRTPMTAIMTYTHMLHDGYGGQLSDEQRELSATIIQASERMISLVNDLLTITRIQNTKDITACQAVSLDHLLSKIRSELQPRIEAKGLVFTTSIAPALPQVATDEVMLHEIISNLIVNAVQYTPAGGTIAANVSSSREQVKVSIIDSGIGIPAEYLPHMFQQFSRADNALAAHPEGTGLGLYVIKILLERIGGTIECKTKIDQGTTFTVSLPTRGTVTD